MTLIYFILILGITIFVHELGHFIFAKKAGIHVYEFAIGMGPKLFSFRRKNDETVYSLRLIPLGGFVQMSGEEINEDLNIPEEKRLQSKTWFQRFLTMIAGALFNFLLAGLLLFFISLIYGAPETRPFMGEIQQDFPTYIQGVEAGDLIISVDGKKMYTWDDVLLQIQLTEQGKPLTFEFMKPNEEIKTVIIEPVLIEENGVESYKYGLTISDNKRYGFLEAVKFTFLKFGTIIYSMIKIIGSLIFGALGLENLAGPIGIYAIVGQEASQGIVNILYLIAFLSINVGFINLLPFPAFDGGKVLFLVIEKIKGSKVNPKVENVIHAVGFALLILLMIIITMQDIRKLFL